MRLFIAAALILTTSIAPAEEAAKSPLECTVVSIDGEKVNLAERYAGKVCLVVNVPSKCAPSPQWEQLVALHKKYESQGLTILAFPAKDFDKGGSSLPGSSRM